MGAGAADVLGLDIEITAKSMLAAGMVGVFIATNSAFAAEKCGCQAECGAGLSITPTSKKLKLA